MLAVLTLIGSRLLWSIPLLFAATVITFVLVALSPGDVAGTILGPYATQAELDDLRVELGLNRPWYVQYFDWLGSALQGDLGRSAITSQSVVEILNNRLGPTLSLAICGTLVSLVIGLGLGILSATRTGAVSRAIDIVAGVGIGLPNFWVGTVLASIFAVSLHLLPAIGYVPITSSVGGWVGTLILPVATLTIGGVMLLARQTRDAMRDILARDFIDALRAAGVSEAHIVFRHALRSAALPILTMVGVFFVGILGGAVIVENVFAMPGLGTATVTASISHDVPLIQGITVYYCIGVILVNLLVDVGYALLDPKVRTA
ncbi:ABC transporter permease [Okibacterium endophyticum]